MKIELSVVMDTLRKVDGLALDQIEYDDHETLADWIEQAPNEFFMDARERLVKAFVPDFTY